MPGGKTSLLVILLKLHETKKLILSEHVLNYLIIKYISHPGILHFAEKHNIKPNMTGFHATELIATNCFINLSIYERYTNQRFKLDPIFMNCSISINEGVNLREVIHWTIRLWEGAQPDFSIIIASSSVIKHREKYLKIIEAYHQGRVKLDVQTIVQKIFPIRFNWTTHAVYSLIANVESLKDIFTEMNYRGKITCDKNVRLESFQQKILNDLNEWCLNR